MPGWISGGENFAPGQQIYDTPPSTYLGFGNNATLSSGYSGFLPGATGDAPGSDDPQDFQQWLSAHAALLAGNTPFNYNLNGDGTPIDPNTLPGPGQTIPGMNGTAQNSTRYNIFNGIGQSLGSPQGLWNAVQGNINAPASNWWTSPQAAFGGLFSLAGGQPGTVGTPGTGASNVAFGNPNAFAGFGGSLNQIAGQQGLPYQGTGLGGNTGLTGSAFPTGSGQSGTPMSFADWAAYNAWAGVPNPTGAPITTGPTGTYNGGNVLAGGYGGIGPDGTIMMDPFGVNSSPWSGAGNFGAPNTGYNGGSGNSLGGDIGGFNPGGNNMLPPYTVTDTRNTNLDAPAKPGNLVNPGAGTIDPPGFGGFTPPGTTTTTPTQPGTLPPPANPGTIDGPGGDNGPGPTFTGGGTGTSGDRNAYLEGLAQNGAEAGLAPQQLAQYGNYSGANAAIDARNLGISLFGAGGPSTIAGQYGALTQGQQDPLLQQQNGIASQLLSQGGNLSASDLRNVQQSSRAGYAARGLDATNSSIVDEAMQTDAARRNRLIQNLGIASGVVGQNQAGQSIINANNNSLFGLAANQTNQSNAYTRSQFDPFSNYGMDLANTNYNAGQARNISANNNALALTIAGQNADAAKSAATTSTLGNIFGAWLGRCWVAREVYGVENMDWRLFRHWLETKAPMWFVRLYDLHGPAFALFLKRNPRLKYFVRLWMDTKVKLARKQIVEGLNYGI